MKSAWRTAVMACAGMVAGCSVFDTADQPKIVKTKVATAAFTQADQRAVLFFSGRDNAFACPEPSPDVKVDLDASLKNTLDAAVKSGKVDAELKDDLEATRKLSSEALLQRSQGLQVLRDMLFQACLANLRGDMRPNEYMDFVTHQLPTLTQNLIVMEYVTHRDKDSSPITGGDLTSLLNYLLLSAPASAINEVGSVAMLSAPPAAVNPPPPPAAAAENEPVAGKKPKSKK